MRDANTRGGIFAGEGDAFGGGVFNGNESGFGGLGATYEQAAAGLGMHIPCLPGSYRDASGHCRPRLRGPSNIRRAMFGVGAMYERAAIGALQSPTGQSWNTPTYQTCIASAFQTCGQQYDAGPDQDACLESAQNNCITLAKAGLTGPAMSSSQVAALQAKINVLLTKYEYCPIAVDGKLGQGTCGAAEWAGGQPGSGITVPGACGTPGLPGKPFALTDCPSGKPLPCPTTAQFWNVTHYECCPSGQVSDPHNESGCIPAPHITPAPPPVKTCPSGQMIDPVTGACVPLAAPKTSHATMWIVGGLAAAAVLAGIAVAAKKKGH